MKYTKLNYFASQSSHTHFVYLAQGAAETYLHIFTCNFGFVTAENEPAKNVLSGEQLWEKS